MSHGMRRYLFWFAHKHCDFRIPEMMSIFSMYGVNVCGNMHSETQPYCIVNLPSESTARMIVSRAVCIRFCVELWASAKEYGDFHEQLKNYPNSEITKYCGKQTSFKIVVETFCKHFSQREKLEKIESFSYLSLEGPVKLNSPDTTLYYIEFYGLDSNHKPEKPYAFFFGRWIAEGQRDFIQKLSLKTRKFIGNTSMDPELSLIMANQAKIKQGDLVFDPFVGSGSLLVAASHFGGYTLGTDIDFLMLHGRTRPSRKSQKERDSDENVAANMSQYGILSYFVDVLVADFSYPLWRSNMRMNAIITDPPYGIREATERIGTTKSSPIIEEHQIATHIPSKVSYNFSDMYKDLLTFSAIHLELNGRLVCWFPVFRVIHLPFNQVYRYYWPWLGCCSTDQVQSTLEFNSLSIETKILHKMNGPEPIIAPQQGDFDDIGHKIGELLDHYSEDKLPTHSCLQLVANSEQVLSKFTSRRLLTYEKLKHPQESDECATIKSMDFREKYFGLRDETRKEKRAKKSAHMCTLKQQLHQTAADNIKR